MVTQQVATVPASEVVPSPPPPCPTCGERMVFYGGTAGFICCGWKLLYRTGGWFDETETHVSDRRISGNTRVRRVTDTE